LGGNPPDYVLVLALTLVAWVTALSRLMTLLIPWEVGCNGFFTNAFPGAKAPAEARAIARAAAPARPLDTIFKYFLGNYVYSCNRIEISNR
jgi:hypothetical protein